MKKLNVVLLIIILLLSGCAAPADAVEPNIKASINALIETKVSSVNNVNMEDLMSILDPEDIELQTEQKNWLIDIKTNPIKSYSLDMIGLQKVSETVYRAKLLQQYKDSEKLHKLVYYNKYRLIDGKLFDAGNYFEELKQGNIIIKYTPANKKLSEEVIGEINMLYQENTEKWGLTPKRSLVIKMFDDIEELRQSIKFSMWSCAGWYEYGESVKMYGTKLSLTKERIEQVVNHEMTHLFTVEKSSGNLAYWLSEGLASYYEVPSAQRSPSELVQDMHVNLLTIDALEALELEKLEDQQKIRDYYNNAHLITAFIIEKYGADKINEILIELGKQPSFSGATSENDKHYREYLSQVVPKVLGIKDYEVFKQEWDYKMKEL